MSTYDDWKLATPPEYEREEEAGAPAAGLPEVHRCASWICLICGACPLCGDQHGEFCEVIKETLEPEEDITW